MGRFFGYRLKDFILGDMAFSFARKVVDNFYYRR